ncbi:MAG: PBP1A family penicillin-binding protein [Alphaproteobacteria bacterium]|nr:PBP1A family penicillin-binding protein [Alphaproteobacteria bacterium]
MADPPPLRVGPDERDARSAARRRREAPRRREPTHGRRGWGRQLLRLAVLLFLWAAIIGGGAIGYFALTLPDTDQLTAAERRPSVTILAADGSILATFGDLFGQPLTLKQMSPWLPKAVIATEDRRFYSHFGIDPVGLVRAAFADVKSGHLVQGGSTITQQLAKTVFLTPERSLGRKIREALLALWLERHFNKDQILEIYLNRVYLGAGAYGVDAAAHRYFGKSAAKLNLYESAVLAGLLKAPTRFSPTRDKEKTAARAAQVLDLMVETGAIDQPQEAAAQRSGVELNKIALARPGMRYFADWVADQVRDFAGTGDRDLTVRTTLDPRMQAAAESVIADTLARHGLQDVVSQGALVAMTPDGAVRAMVGGRDYNESQFNRATQAQRQPGSAFKPFVYLAGIEAGLRPGDRFVDGPIQIGNWRPHNYTNKYLGEISVAEALAESVNTVAVQVAQRAGILQVIAAANRLGITSDLARDASIALGTNEVNLLELVSAYAPFANGGNGVLAYGISEIRDSSGAVVYRRAGSGPGQVVPPDEVGVMNQLLSGVIAHGTGKAAALPRPAAGKTGTTQEYRDAWFIGYTADLVAGVWFGNDDNTPMNKVTGGSLPAPAWKAFMLAATQGMPIRPLPTEPVEAAPVPQRGLGQLIGQITAPPPQVLPVGTILPAPHD